MEYRPLTGKEFLCDVLTGRTDFKYTQMTDQNLFDCEEYDHVRKQLLANFVRFNFSQSEIGGLVVPHLRLDEAVFAQSNIYGTEFSGSSLSRTNFDGATILDSSFLQCPLISSSFKHSRILRTDFTDAVIGNCDFTDARIVDSDSLLRHRDVWSCIFNRTVMSCEAYDILVEFYQYRDGRDRKLVAHDVEDDMVAVTVNNPDY